MADAKKPTAKNDANYQRLVRGIANLGGIPVNHFFKDFYHMWPGNDQKKAFLGSGGFGDTYTVQSCIDRTEPVKVCKVQNLEKLSREDRDIRHTCAELAVLMKVSPHCHQLNRARDIYYDRDHLYIVLDMTEAKVPDLATRLYSLVATYRPQSIPDVEPLVENIQNSWELRKAPMWTEHYKKSRAVEDDDDATETALAMQTYLAGKKTRYFDEKVLSVMQQLGAQKEEGNRMDLWDAIDKSHHKRLPEAKAAVILKQCLQGLEYLHRSAIVHRDIKTENVILGISKIAVPKRDADGKVVGVTFREKIDAQVIDFGMAKHLKCNSMAQTPSLDMFGAGSPNPIPGFGTAPAASAPANQPPAQVAPDFLSGGFGQANAAPAPAAGGFVMPDKNQSTLKTQFKVVCTTGAGTDVFTALEGLLGSAGGGSKGHWISTADDLPKLDIFGCGTMMFQMTHGFKPFRAPATAPRGRERLKALIDQIKTGAQVSSRLSEPTQRLIKKLLSNDVHSRPTAEEVLQDIYFRDVTDTYIYSVDLQGNETAEVAAIPVAHAPAAGAGRPPRQVPAEATAAAAKDAKDEHEEAIKGMTEKFLPTIKRESIKSEMGTKKGEEDDINAALRDKEDNGDFEGKSSLPPIK